MSTEATTTVEDDRLDRLVELERELADKQSAPDNEGGADPEPPFLTGTVVDADREGDEAVITFQLADDSEYTDRIRWPEYDDPDEPLARILDAANLGLGDFANVLHEEIPVWRTDEDDYEIDIPPARGVGNRLAYRYRRLTADAGHLSWEDGPDSLMPNRWFGVIHGGILAVVGLGGSELLQGAATSGPLAIPVGLTALVLFLVGLVGGLLTFIGTVSVLGRLLGAICRWLFPPEPY